MTEQREVQQYADSNSHPTFELRAGGVKTTARIEGDTFTVLAGSQARAAEAESFKTHHYQDLRRSLIADGMLKPSDTPGYLTFTHDTPFSSVSAAAAITLGRAANGKTEWRVASGEEGEGVTYGAWLESNHSNLPLSLTAEEPEALVASWQPFFRTLAVKLLDYEQRQLELVHLLLNADVKVQHDENEALSVMDPFSFFSMLLKHQSPTRLAELMTIVGEELGISEEAPTEFVGVPWSNPMNSWFFAYRSYRQPNDLPTLWKLARQAVAGQLDEDTFKDALEIRAVALAKLTQGLFWLNPQAFLALNSVNVAYLERRGIHGAGRVETLEAFHKVLDAARPLTPDFATLSYLAWKEMQKGKDPAQLEGDAFPFDSFRAEADRLANDIPKANMVLDRRYAPLLISLMENVDRLSVLHPERQPYTAAQQVGVKVGLGKGQGNDIGWTAQAFLFPKEAHELQPLPAGLTLRASLLDGSLETLHLALEDEVLRERLALEVVSAKEQPGKFTLTFDLSPRSGYAATAEELSKIRSELAGELGKNARLQVDYCILPEALQSDIFPEALADGLTYLERVAGVMAELAKTGNARSQRHHETERTVQPIGIEEPEAATADSEFKPPAGVPLNQILYGPPGTGKTYGVVDEALRVLDPAFLTAHSGPAERAACKARYDALSAAGQVSFVTFHQSFGYEDFIEGVKPVFEDGQLRYELEDGVFLQAVRSAGGVLEDGGAPTRGTAPRPSRAVPTPPQGLKADGQVWRIYIDGTVPVSQIRERSVARGEIRVGTFPKKFGQFQEKPANLNDLSEDRIHPYQLFFRDSIRDGDLVLLATGSNKIGAVGVVTGEYRYDPYSEAIFSLDYTHARPVRWLAKDLNLSAQDVIGKTFAPPTLQRVTGVTPEQVLRFLPGLANSKATISHTRPHVLIIDEINRGNVAKIFGELITLLEPSKRAEASESLTVTLPLSKRKLRVPASLYLIGTMNTADRSLTQLDAALRRRFVFRPVWPQPEVLPIIEIDDVALDLRKFLHAINQRIEHLLSREQVIGHTYLLGIPETLEGIASALQERILPLLEEYFFEDWSHIREVLGDDNKPDELQFIQEEHNSGGVRYTRNPNAFGDIEAFVRVYNGLNDSDFPFT